MPSLPSIWYIKLLVNICKADNTNICMPQPGTGNTLQNSLQMENEWQREGPDAANDLREREQQGSRRVGSGVVQVPARDSNNQSIFISLRTRLARRRNRSRRTS